jgi:hypothetical protein
MRSINSFYVDERFDFERYIVNIVGEDDLICVYYYNGYSKKKINENVWNRQNKLFNRLKRLKNWNVILFRKQECCDENDKTFFKLKEDDINLAVDVLSDAYENKFDKMILISGDRDFLPLIRQVKKLKKEVGICYFKDCVSKKFLKLFEEKNKKKITKSVVRRYFLRKNKKVPQKISEQK